MKSDAFPLPINSAFDDPSHKEPPAWVQNFSQLFLLRAAKNPKAPALYEKRLGLWEELTWDGYAKRAEVLGHGLMALGLQKGDVVSVLADNSPDWVALDMATLGFGGICSGIYTTDSAQQVAYLLSDSNTRVVIVENDEQLDKVLSQRDKLPNLAKIIVRDMKGLHKFSHPDVLSLAALTTMGEAHLSAHPGAWRARSAEQRPEDPAIIVYTSGTTGPAKGALATHGNLLFTAYSVRAISHRPEGHALLSFLPLCHMAERIVGAYLAVMCGNVLYFAESMETVPENLREVQPQIMLAVPRIWEKLNSQVTLALREGVGLQRWIYTSALRLGQARVARREAGGKVPLPLEWGFKAADFFVLRNLRRMLGLGRCHSALTGAAPISPELIRWYRALGLTMQEGYGQTESTCFLTLTPRDFMGFGTIGLPIPGVELRLSEEGEIQARGGNVFSHYLNKPEKTHEAKTADGWLRTGDVGRLLDNGMYKIIDRLKDIIITAGGKNITPSELENQLKFSPFITDAVVVGDQRPYLTCLVMIDHDNVAKFAQDQNVPFSNFASLTRAPEVRALIEAEIARINPMFARVEQIKKFHIIDRVLTPEDDELTPTMKLKRKFVNEKFSAEINAMYRG